MESGWFYPFDTPRQFMPGERRREGLPRDPKRLGDVEADERGGLLHLNSTYLDIIDRWFRIRGGMSSILALVCTVVLFGGFFFYLFFVFIAYYMNGALDLAIEIGLVCIFALGVVFPFFIARKSIGRDFFAYTHYPIRFNRKTQMIHVFRHNGPGGVLSVPWDQAYFHVGKGSHDRSLLDLRGHVLDADGVVLDTFAVGHFFNTQEPLRQLWKFIVIYMEQGPQAVPQDIAIMTSTRTSFKNCLMWSISFCNVFLPIPLFKWVFALLVLAMRWCVMKSCKEPQWPAPIEAESVIESNDPQHWPEPLNSGDLDKDDKVWAALLARARRRDAR